MRPAKHTVFLRCYRTDVLRSGNIEATSGDGVSSMVLQTNTDVNDTMRRLAVSSKYRKWAVKSEVGNWKAIARVRRRRRAHLKRRFIKWEPWKETGSRCRSHLGMMQICVLVVDMANAFKSHAVQHCLANRIGRT